MGPPDFLIPKVGLRTQRDSSKENRSSLISFWDSEVSRLFVNPNRQTIDITVFAIQLKTEIVAIITPTLRLGFPILRLCLGRPLKL